MSPMIASASVDLPQPDSPTSPRHSPGFTSKLTPSTALRVLMPPDSAPPTMKCTASSSSASKGASSASAMMVAPHDSRGRQRRHFGGHAAADVGDRGAARVEAAARRIGGDRGHYARDLAQPLLAAPRALAQPWQRVYEALRIGMARRGEDRIGDLCLDDAAGIHHRHALAHVGDQAEIVADHQDGGATL